MTMYEQAIALARLGFHVFPIVENKKAPPRMEGWQRYATRDVHKIQAMWRSHPNDNIGISTSKFGAREALLCVDIDNKGEKRGDDEVLRLELEGWELPDTYTQTTPTGGRHVVYRVGAPVRQGADVLGRGLDIRSRGGYVVGAGSSIGELRYTADLAAAIAPAPDWLIERCGRASVPREPGTAAVRPEQLNAERALARAIAYLKSDAFVGVDGSRNDTGFKVAARCKDFGVDEATCAALMAEHWMCTPPLDAAELAHVVHSAYRYGLDAPGAAAPEVDFDLVPKSGTIVPKTGTPPAHPFGTMNAEHAFVLAGGGAHILWETRDHNDKYKLEHLAIGAFHAKFAALEIQVGKKSSPVTMEWMRWPGRRSFDGIVFIPEKEAPPRFYNLWRGFAVKPASDGNHPAVASFLDHLRTNVCHGDAVLADWLLGYFAHLVQRPWEKPLTALVFKGEKGVGKNALVNCVGNLLGHHYLVTSNRRYLIGNFNGHLEHTLLFTLDEAFWSGDKQSEGVLKDLITGGQHVIEHKGKEPFTIENRTRIVILGNEEWLVPASHDERRFAVFEMGDARRGDGAFFQTMREGMEAGGYAHLLRFLLDHPISDVNVAPSTAGLLEQKHATLNPVLSWWLVCLDEGRIAYSDVEDWPAKVECERMRAAFRRYATDRRITGWIQDERGFGREMHKAGIAKHRIRVAGTLTSTYLLPPLVDARAAWDKFIGHPVVWPA